ncbi:restriction endonuclease [Ornithinibacillus halotolerans]|uniref:Restriction endonuclease n=1 Tax=Ornithinibacillus halotolerans TaxID=1274357 RepID=A0A916W5P7_9BACI|nr:restriction endonuclease [Ornithinibacillus halotolerans]GGA68236.1 hypothetical protein GCM10008025_10230 [Ornithinibacillus halotolerans]
MNRGYAGYYKEHYLRSSYEYAYARYLDFKKISWSYESEVYDIGYKLYKPDFFLYDENGNLTKIVEVKSRNRNEKAKALNALEIISKRYNIDCELVSYEELLEIYKKLPFSLTATINEWINSNSTTINKAAFGKLNGHYNMVHSEETKRIIGNHTKKLWQSNSLSKQRMVEGLRNSGLSQKGKIKIPREERTCIECNSKYIVIRTSTKKYCSRTCSGNSAIRKATQAYVIQRNDIHINIKKFIIKWSVSNRELVLSIPYNRISSSLAPLINKIEELYGVKDMRVISKAVFGKDCGRKELLKFMKKVCNENVC